VTLKPVQLGRDFGDSLEVVAGLPRHERPSGSTGGKEVFVDEVIWRHIADPWDAAEDLAAGKVDWWEEPPLDFIPKIEQNPDLRTIEADWTQGWLRPNCLHPPFNNKKARPETFDNDGTLWAEQPLYFQLFFAIDRVKALTPQHPEWKDKEPLTGCRTAAPTSRPIAALPDRAERILRSDKRAIRDWVGKCTRTLAY